MARKFHQKNLRQNYAYHRMNMIQGKQKSHIREGCGL